MLDFVKGVIFDIDGVLEYQGNLYPGAIELVNGLKAKGIVVRFLTNSTLKSRTSCAEKLANKGFNVVEAEVVTASYATSLYLKELNPQSIWLWQAREGCDQFTSFKHDEINPEYLVIGDYRDGFNFENLNKALRILAGDTKLIGMISEFTDSSLGCLEINVGAWVKLLELTSGKQAIYIGKPYPVSMQMTLSTMNLPQKNVIMVGDRITSDIAGAKAAGIVSVLLKQGEFKESHLKQGIIPDYQFETIMDFKKNLLD